MPPVRLIGPVSASLTAAACLAAAALLGTVVGSAQVPEPPPGPSQPYELPAPSSMPSSEPSPAMKRLVLERRGQLLAERQRLEESAAFYGRNHPSSQAAMRQLATVERQLELWTDATTMPTPADLSELVLRLTIKVDTLERQVAALRRAPSGR